MAKRNSNNNIYTSGSRGNSQNESFNTDPGPRPPQVGYVTLNQTRKIIPLLENDPIVSLAPLVGVWTAFNDWNDTIIKNYDNVNDNITNSNNYNNSYDYNNNSNNDNNRRRKDSMSTSMSHVNNPLTWAISMRFLFNEFIKDRAFVDEETFLLVSGSIEMADVIFFSFLDLILTFVFCQLLCLFFLYSYLSLFSTFCIYHFHYEFYFHFFSHCIVVFSISFVFLFLSFLWIIIVFLFLPLILFLLLFYI